MSVPSSHILPSSHFRHIGFMMAFMVLIACFATIGFVGVKDLTSTWMVDVDHTLSIEIPPYNNSQILSKDDINQNLKTIQNILKNDPIIKSLDVYQADGITHDNFNIPAPTFITISLRPNRAINAEDRLITNIQKSIPIANIKHADEWQRDIQKTAMILKLIFGGVMVCVLLVTTILSIATIHMQIKSNTTTIELIHLMGGASLTIANLFKSSITRPLLWGGLIGCLVVLICLYPVLQILDMTANIFIHYGIILGVFIFFCILIRCVTHITVMRSLRSYP